MPTFSTYTYTLNCIDALIDFESSLRSAAAIADEVVVLDVGSTDGTREKLEALAGECKNVKVFEGRWDNSDKAADWKTWRQARSKCTQEWAMVWAADWAMRADDGRKMRDVMAQIDEPVVIHLPIANMWRRADTVDMGQLFHFSLAPNIPEITHGFWKGNTPETGSKTTYYDSDGNPYADWSKSDGVEFIFANTRDLVPPVVVVPPMLVQAHAGFLRGEVPAEPFARELEMFYNVAPTIFHYGWLSLPRKARWYMNAVKADFAWNAHNFEKDAPRPGESFKDWSDRLEAQKPGWLLRGLHLNHPPALESWQNFDPPAEEVFAGVAPH